MSAEALRALDDTDNLAISAEEGQLLSNFVRASCPMNLLEIGTGHGYSTVWMGLSMHPKATLYTIDREPYAHLLDRGFTIGRVERLTGTLEDLIHKLPENLDLVFHDSEHQIEKIVRDIEHVEPRLNAKALVIVHDTEYCPEMGRCLEDYFLGRDTGRLKSVGVKPSHGKWNYQSFKTRYGLGVAIYKGKS